MWCTKFDFVITMVIPFLFVTNLAVEREREREGGREGGRERERERGKTTSFCQHLMIGERKNNVILSALNDQISHRD